MELITDLAYIMVVAGVVTILFKRLKQPLVLGYIVAGFLAGPHMPYMPTVNDTENIETWSQIGVIFLMFSLGIEFSFKKIVKMGVGPIITALSIMFFMISLGSAVGWLFGWNSMNRLFLGGMMAMSSTTIIYKAFDDLGLRQQPFAKGVMSTLILEDILGILLMVVLSALAVSRQFEGMALLTSMLQLGFFLALWFIVGIFVIPLFLKRNSRFINAETLLIVSVGMCFLFVILAHKAGYSPAFGAFMIGSILAETLEAERIEHVTGSLKNLFGAIFFVSVGMLVDPQVLVSYWLPILVIVLAILVGQSFFGTMSFILGGQNLKGGIKSGFSMAQIGEFAFILAALGNTLGVTSDFLYPVVVAVSIITTFLTPYMIKLADPVYDRVEGFLPKRMRNYIDKGAKRMHSKGGGADVNGVPLSWLTGGNPGYSYIEKQQIYAQKGVWYVWGLLLKQLFIQTICYSILSVAAITLALASLLPLCRSIFTHWPGNTICGLLTLVAVSFFLRPIVIRKNHSEEIKYLSKCSVINRFFIRVLLLLRFSLAVYAVYVVLDYLSPFRWYWHILVSCVIVFYMIRSQWVKLCSIRLERTFRLNLSRRDRHQSATNAPTAYARPLYGRDIHISTLTVPVNSNWAGKRLNELNFGRDNGIIIVAIVRDDLRINIPDGNAVIYPRDLIEVVGDDESIEAFSQMMESDCTQMENGRNISIRRIVLTSDSPLVGKAVREAGIRKHLHAIVIGTEQKDGTLQMITPSQVLKKGDILWIVG